MDIQPFRALRPVRDKVHLVATKPFYAYKKNVLKAKMQSNPFSYLHIINPDLDLLTDNSALPSGENKYQLVCNQYKKFIHEGILIRDEKPSFYLYRQSCGETIFSGIITAASVEDYNTDKIKKHEATLTSREEVFTNYLDVVGYNAEPVLLSHSPSNKLNVILDRTALERPEYEFTTTDYVKHELWVISGETCQEIKEIFKEIGISYIADGHHRCASSAGLHAKRLSQERTTENDGYFLSYLIDESKIKIFEYNRLVRMSINKEFLLSELEKNFFLTKIKEKRKPKHEHEIVMVFHEEWYSLICKPEIIQKNHPVKSLDAEILTDFVLDPILGISDLKTDKNIGFISGIENMEKLNKKMLKGNFNIAFLLHPATIEQIKQVADNGLTMPPKSTWIEPKMRSGITIYCINE